MTSSTPIHKSIADEIDEAKAMFPAVNVLTSTPSFLIATYQRSPYTRIKMTMTFPSGYPEHTLIVNIDQDVVVPPGLKKKLEKELNNVAIEQPTQQVRAVWERLVSFVDTNLFVPCWKELKQCVDMIQKHQPSTITLFEGKGKIKLSLKNEAYYINCSIIIDPAYPDFSAELKQCVDMIQKHQPSTITLFEGKGKIKLSLKNEAYYINCSIIIDPAYPDFSAAVTGGKACLLQLQTTNFPTPIANMMMTQAQDIVRRMQEGLSSEKAMNLSNPVKVPKNFNLNIDEYKEKYKARLTKDTISNIKHDTEALKKVSDLRNKEASSVRASGDNGYVDHKALHKDRKDARRAIKKLTDEEKAADLRFEEKELEWQLEEKKRLAGYYDVYNVPAGGTISPQPSLYVLISFLVQKVHGLVAETCPCCNKRVLPVRPEDLESIYNTSSSSKSDKKAKEMRKMKPYRTYCGCWYHKSCLNTLLTEPPFGCECPNVNCGRRVFHPDWPGDIKQLEREWSAKQARQREIEDAMLFL
ncbi:hypothetical protein ACHAWC_003930 [Mediolabrus comicus]